MPETFVNPFPDLDLSDLEGDADPLVLPPGATLSLVPDSSPSGDPGTESEEVGAEAGDPPLNEAQREAYELILQQGEQEVSELEAFLSEF